MLRVSYSMLSAWARGDYQRAIDMLLRVESPTTPQMEAGKEWHKKWELEAIDTGCLPAVFGSRQLTAPQFEIKIEKNIGSWLQLVGVLDVYDAPVGVDYKTGVSAATVWAGTHQHQVYQILKPEMKRFEYLAYNQYTRDVTVSIVHLSDKSLKEGIIWVLKNAHEIRAYMEANDMKQVLKEAVYEPAKTT